MVMGWRFLGVIRGGGTGGALLSSGVPPKTCQKKTREEIRLGLTRQHLHEQRGTFLCSSIRISTTIFWNLMSNMAATVSTWALISVGPKITAMLEGVIRLSSLWLHTLWTDAELSSWTQVPLEITSHNRGPYVTKCLMSISSISRFFSGNL